MTGEDQTKQNHEKKTEQKRTQNSEKNKIKH